MSTYLGSWLRYVTGMRLAPFVPVPPVVANEMLSLARLKPGETVVDLGCGDGRLLNVAVERFGAAQAVGYELDEHLVRIAREAAGSDERIIVHNADALQAAESVRSADVVTLYLTAAGNKSLLPLLRDSLMPGARVVSYVWGMDGLRPSRTATARGKDVVLTLPHPNILLWELDELLPGDGRGEGGPGSRAGPGST